MSYDVSLVLGTGPGTEVEVWSGNMTSNVSRAWSDALDLPDRPRLDQHGRQLTGSRTDPATGDPEQVPLTDSGLRLLHGAPASEAAGVLTAAVERMRAWSPERLRSYDAPNGWGTGEGALRFLDEIATAARAHPAGTITVCS